MDVNSSSEAGAWLKPVGEIFLGLNMSAVIRRVVGAVEIVPGLMALQLQGLTWQEFVNHYADETARSSLKAAWMAMAEHRVAPAYWPPYLPFKRGVIARLRPVENDPIISFVVHRWRVRSAQHPDREPPAQRHGAHDPRRAASFPRQRRTADRSAD
jgi:hypothetical protein